MYKIVKIKYRSVMVSGDCKESVDHYVNGTIHHNDGCEHIFFTSKEGVNFEFVLTDHELTLKQNQSELKLHKENIISNMYTTPYGQLALNTKLLLLEKKDNFIKIKYELYQEQECISKIYMQIAYFEIN